MMSEVLDVGCGHISRRQRYGGIGIDRKKGVCDVQADAHHLPFREQTFDKVVMIHVLEHLMNPDQALDEVRRVLTPHGVLEIEVPNPSSFWIFKENVFSRKPLVGGVESNREHVYSFGEAELQNIIRIKGFTIIEIKYDWSRVKETKFQHYDLAKKIFYRVLFRLFPAFRTALRIQATRAA